MCRCPAQARRAGPGPGRPPPGRRGDGAPGRPTCSPRRTRPRLSTRPGPKETPTSAPSASIRRRHPSVVSVPMHPSTTTPACRVQRRGQSRRRELLERAEVQERRTSASGERAEQLERMVDVHRPLSVEGRGGLPDRIRTGRPAEVVCSRHRPTGRCARSTVTPAAPEGPMEPRCNGTARRPTRSDDDPTSCAPCPAGEHALGIGQLSVGGGEHPAGLVARCRRGLRRVACGVRSDRTDRLGDLRGDLPLRAQPPDGRRVALRPQPVGSCRAARRRGARRAHRGDGRRHGLVAGSARSAATAARTSSTRLPDAKSMATT